MKQFVLATMSYHTGKIEQKKVSAVNELEALRELYRCEADIHADELSAEEIYERLFNIEMLVSVFEL
jgi:hypothetical protein